VAIAGLKTARLPPLAVRLDGVVVVGIGDADVLAGDLDEVAVGLAGQFVPDVAAAAGAFSVVGAVGVEEAVVAVDG
jgi:hypothetical protein